MNEKGREFNLAYAAVAIIACQVLGIDITAVASLMGSGSTELLETIRAANSGDGGMWAGLVSVAAFIGRSYVKGKLQQGQK